MNDQTMSLDSSKQAFTISEMNFVNNPRSLNNRFILEAFIGSRDLKSKESNGFAMLSQKVSLVGLKLLADARLADGTFIPKGSIAYIKESMILTQEWGKTALECPGIDGKFIIVDVNFIELVVPA